MKAWSEWLISRLWLARQRPGHGITIRPGVYFITVKKCDYLIINVKNSDGLQSWLAAEFLIDSISPGFPQKSDLMEWLKDGTE